MASKKLLSLISIFLIVIITLSSVVVYQNLSGTDAKTPDVLGLLISPVGGSFDLGVNQSKTFTVTALNGTGPYTYSWKLSPTEGNFNLSINGNVNNFASTESLTVNGDSLTLCYPQATKEYVSIQAFAVDASGLEGESGVVVVADPYTSPGYKFDGSTATYTYKISADGLGWYRAYKGSTGQAMKAWDSDDLTDTLTLALAAMTSGTLFLDGVAFDLALMNNIGVGVQVVESNADRTRTFINSADSLGSPYTVTVEGVNYFAQDSGDRICWSSLDYITVFTSVVAALPNGTGIIVDNVNDVTFYYVDGQLSYRFASQSQNNLIIASEGVIGVNSRPSAIFYKNHTYVAWQDGKRNIGITDYNHDTNTLSKQIIGGRLRDYDDHFQPSLYIRDDERIVVIYTYGNPYSISYGAVAISDRAMDISMWTVEGIENFGSYPQIVEQSDGVYLFTRRQTGEWQYRISTDEMQTFGAATLLTDFPSPDNTGNWTYVMPYAYSTNRIDFALGDYRLTAKGMYHFYMESDNFYKTDGTLIKADSSPITDTNELTKVYTVPDGWTGTYSWDCTVKNSVIYIAFASYQSLGSSGFGSGDYRAMWATYTDGSWVTSQITTMGNAFPDSYNYDTGLSLDSNDPTKVYVSAQQENGNFQIEEWQTSDSGTSWIKNRDWSSDQDVSVDNSGKRARPISVRDHDGRIPVIWMEGYYDYYFIAYSAGTEARFKTQIVAGFSNQTINPPSIIDYSQTQQIVNSKLNAGLVGFWGFAEYGRTTNASMIYDSSLFGYNGVVNGATWRNDAVQGSVLDFDGSNDYVKIDSYNGLVNATEFSIVYTIKVDAIPAASQKILSRNQSFQVEIRNTGIISTTFTLGATTTESIINYTNYVGNWMTIALTFDGTAIHRYINGVPYDGARLEAKDLTSMPNVSYPLYIGCRYSEAEFFDGSIKQMLLYNEAKQPNEILCISNGITPPITGHFALK